MTNIGGMISSVVSKVVKVFCGQWCTTDALVRTGTQFYSRNDLLGTFCMVKMLSGWDTNIDPHQKFVLHVLKSS